MDLAKGFICVKLHFGENGEIAKMLGVSRPPNVRVISAKGDTIKVFEGGAAAEDLAKAMGEALAKK